MPIPNPVDLDRCAPVGVGGLLSAACPLPDGWERGISFLDDACLQPSVMAECPTCPDLKPTQNVEYSTFLPVRLIQSVECSTMGGVDVPGMAGTALDQTIGYALAREMLTGQASARDANPNDDEWFGNPSLQCAATDLGDTFATIREAIGCLEAALGVATAGRPGVLLMGPQVALAAESVLVRDGARWSTFTGTRVIISPAFDGRAPGCIPDPDCDTEYPAPVAGDPLYIYAVPSVWAGTGRRDVLSDINRGTNSASARAEEIGLAAFSTCAVFAAASTAVTACTIERSL